MAKLFSAQIIRGSISDFNDKGGLVFLGCQEFAQI